VIGALANGALSLLIVGRALFTDGSVAALPSPRTGHHDTTAGPQDREPGSTAVVFNPTVTGEAALDEPRRILEQHGHRAPAFIETTVDAPGTGQAVSAVRDGATRSCSAAAEPSERPRTPWPARRPQRRRAGRRATPQVLR